MLFCLDFVMWFLNRPLIDYIWTRNAIRKIQILTNVTASNIKQNLVCWKAALPLANIWPIIGCFFSLVIFAKKDWCQVSIDNHIKTSQLICNANELTGFYMITHKLLKLTFFWKDYRPENSKWLLWSRL